MKHFISAVSYVKNRQFEMWVPAFFHPAQDTSAVGQKPTPLEKPNIYRPVATLRRPTMPYRQVVDPNQMQRASYSLEVMFLMFSKKIEFELAHEEDVVEIIDIIDRYLISLRPDVEQQNEAVIAYVELVIKARAEMYKHYYRYMMTHPAALERLYPNEKREDNFISLLIRVAGGDTKVEQLDPLKAKGHPPYDIAKIKDSRTVTVTSEVAMSDNFGIANANSLLSDDGKSFDLGDFLKG